MGVVARVTAVMGRATVVMDRVTVAAHHLPEYNRWLETCDWQPAYDYHRWYLQWLQHGEPDKRWILKAPGHLLSLPALINTYPDARLVQLHRDPAEVIPSMASLFLHLRRPFSHEVDPAVIGQDVTRQWSKGLSDTLQLRTDNPDINARFIDIHYRELVEDPTTTLGRILKFVGVEETEASARAVGQYLEANPKGKHGSHRYSLAQFGLNSSDLEAAFSDYNRRYQGLTPAKGS